MESKPVRVSAIEEKTIETDVAQVELTTSFKNMQLVNARNIGEFFDHRLKFFKIDAPSIVIGTSPVNEMVLYFVDSTLARIRYTLEGDVSNHLLDSLGLSRFKPLDDRSKELLASKNVWNRYNKKLHEDLRNYELVWRKPGSVTRFRVRKDGRDSTNTFLYYHEMQGYKETIREIETIYQVMDKQAIVYELD
ncbi:MAG: hypothetical protein AAFN93_03285 [Bacteroidota bacterium]